MAASSRPCAGARLAVLALLCHALALSAVPTSPAPPARLNVVSAPGHPVSDASARKLLAARAEELAATAATSEAPPAPPREKRGHPAAGAPPAPAPPRRLQSGTAQAGSLNGPAWLHSMLLYNCYEFPAPPWTYSVCPYSIGVRQSATQVVGVMLGSFTEWSTRYVAGASMYATQQFTEGTVCPGGGTRSLTLSFGCGGSVEFGPGPDYAILTLAPNVTSLTEAADDCATVAQLGIPLLCGIPDPYPFLMTIDASVGDPGSGSPTPWPIATRAALVADAAEGLTAIAFPGLQPDGSSPGSGGSLQIVTTATLTPAVPLPAATPSSGSGNGTLGEVSVPAPGASSTTTTNTAISLAVVLPVFAIALCAAIWVLLERRRAAQRKGARKRALLGQEEPDLEELFGEHAAALIRASGDTRFVLSNLGLFYTKKGELVDNREFELLLQRRAAALAEAERQAASLAAGGKGGGGSSEVLVLQDGDLRDEEWGVVAQISAVSGVRFAPAKGKSSSASATPSASSKGGSSGSRSGANARGSKKDRPNPKLLLVPVGGAATSKSDNSVSRSGGADDELLDDAAARQFDLHHFRTAVMRGEFGAAAHMALRELSRKTGWGAEDEEPLGPSGAAARGIGGASLDTSARLYIRPRDAAAASRNPGAASVGRTSSTSMGNGIGGAKQRGTAFSRVASFFSFSGTSGGSGGSPSSGMASPFQSLQPSAVNAAAGKATTPGPVIFKNPLPVGALVPHPQVGGTRSVQSPLAGALAARRAAAHVTSLGAVVGAADAMDDGGASRRSAKLERILGRSSRRMSRGPDALSVSTDSGEAEEKRSGSTHSSGQTASTTAGASGMARRSRVGSSVLSGGASVSGSVAGATAAGSVQTHLSADVAHSLTAYRHHAVPRGPAGGGGSAAKLGLRGPLGLARGAARLGSVGPAARPGAKAAVAARAGVSSQFRSASTSPRSGASSAQVLQQQRRGERRALSSTAAAVAGRRRVEVVPKPNQPAAASRGKPATHSSGLQSGALSPAIPNGSVITGVGSIGSVSGLVSVASTARDQDFPAAAAASAAAETPVKVASWGSAASEGGPAPWASMMHPASAVAAAAAAARARGELGGIASILGTPMTGSGATTPLPVPTHHSGSSAPSSPSSSMWGRGLGEAASVAASSSAVRDATPPQAALGATAPAAEEGPVVVFRSHSQSGSGNMKGWGYQAPAAAVQPFTGAGLTGTIAHALATASARAAAAASSRASAQAAAASGGEAGWLGSPSPLGRSGLTTDVGSGSPNLGMGAVVAETTAGGFPLAHPFSHPPLNAMAKVHRAILPIGGAGSVSDAGGASLPGSPSPTRLVPGPGSPSPTRLAQGAGLAGFEIEGRLSSLGNDRGHSSIVGGVGGGSPATTHAGTSGRGSTRPPIPRLPLASALPQHQPARLPSQLYAYNQQARQGVGAAAYGGSMGLWEDDSLSAGSSARSLGSTASSQGSAQHFPFLMQQHRTPTSMLQAHAAHQRGRPTQTAAAVGQRPAIPRIPIPLASMSVMSHAAASAALVQAHRGAPLVSADGRGRGSTMGSGRSSLSPALPPVSNGTGAWAVQAAIQAATAAAAVGNHSPAWVTALSSASARAGRVSVHDSEGAQVPTNSAAPRN